MHAKLQFEATEKIGVVYRSPVAMYGSKEV